MKALKSRGVIAGAAAFALAMGGLLAGCNRSEPEAVALPEVTVSGEFGSVPTLAYPTPVDLPARASRVIWEGDGPKITPGGTVLLNLFGQDARSSKQLVNTYQELPEVYTVSEAMLGPSMFKLLQGHRAGARLLLAEESEGTPLILVVDALAGRAVGEEVPVRSGLPKVQRAADGTPEVKVPDAKPPTTIQVQPLLRGRGEQVRTGQTVIVQYTAVSWKSGKVIDTTWSAGRAPFTAIVGDSRPVLAWNDGLIEQTVGSQVMIVAPPEAAYGGTDSPWAKDTIIYVVDILYAGTLAVPDKDNDGTDEGRD